MVKTKVLISFAVTTKLVCAFVFVCADCWFSDVVIHVTFLLSDDISLCVSRCCMSSYGCLDHTDLAFACNFNVHTTIKYKNILRCHS